MASGRENHLAPLAFLLVAHCINNSLKFCRAEAMTEDMATKKREINMWAQVSAAGFLILGFIIMILMKVVQSRAARVAETNRGRMEGTLSVDKFLLKILKCFSVKTVEEYIFHGIMPKKHQVSIEFENLCATIKAKPTLPGLKGQDGVKVLTGVSGKFEAGHVAAIMGTSGAGKTTFLNLLCGKLAGTGNWSVTGTVKVDGEEMDLAALKSIMGFVPQDDVVHDRMTVRENIRFSAQLRNTPNTSYSRLRRITDDVLQVLQLEAQQNLLVGNRTTAGGLSGGQRKRVNVGLELAACPTLLFLDEPTSGLDSTGSLMLVRSLQKMTQLGMTIIMVIHQPRYGLFTLIDHVLLLGKGGRTAFFGPTEQAKPYFESLGFVMPPNENPADWFMDVMSGQMEQENPNIRKEELPERLFKEWEEYIRSDAGHEVAHTMTLRNERVGMSEIDDAQVIKAHLKDAWKRVDPPATTALGMEGLTQVLTHCVGSQPQEKVVRDIMHRLEVASSQLDGPAAKLHKKDRVLHWELEKYLVAIQSNDNSIRPVTTSATSYFVDDGSDEDYESDDSSDDEDAVESGSETERKDSRVKIFGSSISCGRDYSRRHSGSPDKRRMHGLTRELPGFLGQLRVTLLRRAIIWWRKQNTRLMFLVVVEFAAFFLGVMDSFIFKNPPWIPTNFMNAQIAIALLTSVYSLFTFGAVEELPVFWRESSHGLNKLAFFIGSNILDSLDMFLMCFGFAAMYYVMTKPALTFWEFVVPFIFVCWVASGWGYFISCWLPYELNSLGPFVSALLSFVFGGILGLPNEMDIYLASPLTEIFVGVLAFTRWGVPMEFFSYVRRSPPDTEQMPIDQKFNYIYTQQYYREGWHLPGDEDYWYTGILALSLIGFVLRGLALAGLHYTNKAKQV